MRAELPLITSSFSRGRRLSAAGQRTLVEGVVRIGDVLAVAVSGLAVAAWRFGSNLDPAVTDPTLAALVIGCLLAANILPRFYDYQGARLVAQGWQLPRLLAGWTVSMAALIALLFALKVTGDVSRLWVGWWFVVGAVALVTIRLVVRLTLVRGETARALVREVAVVGLGEHLARTIARLSDAEPGFRVTTALDLDGSLEGRWPRGVTALQGFADLERRCGAGTVDQIVLALPSRGGDLLERTLRNLRHLTVDIAWVPELPAGRVPVLGVGQIGDLPLVRLLERPLDGWRYVAKDLEDRILASLILVFISPLMLTIGLAVRLGSPGPAFYRQTRHGFNQEPISVFKFRTMYTNMCDAPSATTFRQATKGDPRVTPLGRFLRRTSLDELPQLINVARGEMSLVGPRPHPVALDQLYVHRIDDYLCRHRVKPGITGWAQVNGYRGETTDDESMRRRIEHDLYYIGNWSVFLDLRILWLTIFRGFVNPNAY